MKRMAATIVLSILFVGVVFGQGIGFYGIGGGLGFTNVSFSSESMSGISFHARAELGEIIENLYIVPELSYWSVSKDFGDDDIFGGNYEWSVSDFAINANVQYRFDMEGSIAPYVGGGLGLNFVSSTVDVPFFGSVSASDTKIGLNLLGGAHMNLEGKYKPYAEFRYVVVSDINHLMIMAGIVYIL
jgi:outer membrane immunogenic protein